MLKACWQVVILFVVAWVVVSMVATAIRPFLWVIGAGTAVLIVVFIGKLMFFRRRF